MIYRFNTTVIDSNNYSITDNGAPVTLEPQVFDLIIYLIEHRERLVSRHEILDALWAGKVVTDSVLSNSIKMARAAVGDNGQDQRVIKTVHGRGYQFVANIEDAGIPDSPAPAPNNNAPASQNPKRLGFPYIAAAALFFLIVLVVAFLVFNDQSDLETSNREKSIAVLPFDNNSNRAEDLYFTDGIHGDLLAQISQIKDIKSISRTSVMTYRGSDKNLQDIAKELGVATILEGGVQRSGNQVRINMQLVDAKTDTPIWALTYTRELTAENIFHIQTEIAGAIAQKLKAELSTEAIDRMEAVPTQNLAALELYFKANAEVQKSSSKGYQKAVEYLQEAIALDERFTSAYIELARIYLEQTFYEGLPRDKQLSLAHELVEKVKALEGDSSAVLTIEAQYIEYNNQHDLAEKTYQRAIALNPNNADAYANYGHLQNWIFSDYSKSIQNYEKALSLDPANLSIRQQFAEVLNNGGYPEKAIQELKSIVSQDPNLPTAWLGLCRTYAEALFQFDKAIQACRQAFFHDAGNPFIPGFIAIIYGNLGEFERMAEFSHRAYNLGANTISHLGEQYYAEQKFEEALEAFYQVEAGTIYFRHCNSYIATIGEKYDPVGALQFFKMHYSHLLEPAATVDATTIYPTYYFAKLLEKNDDKTASNRLINLGLAYISENKNSFSLQEYPIITSYFLAAGKNDEAFNFFRQFVERGGAVGETAFVGSMANLLVDFPQTNAWSDRPEFKSLMETMKARLQKQRENLKAWEDNSDLAPIPATH